MNVKPENPDINETYRRVVGAIDNLPSLPAIVTQLLSVVNSPDSSVDDAVCLIEKDPALTGKFLRLANSAFYGMPRTVSSISNAVVILGFNVIRSVVLSVSIMKMFSGDDKRAISKEVFWKHSITTALAAKELVRHLMSFRMVDPESAFCAGMLHDIGRLVFNEYLGAEYVAVCSYAREFGVPLIEAETHKLGISHAGLGCLMAEKWGLPVDLESVIVHHHAPDSTITGAELVNIVHLADLIAHELGADLWEGEAHTPEWDQSRALLHLDNDAYDRVCTRTVSAAESSLEFLSIIK
ncbi:MAG: HDOD domain-containing protein [Chitinispirillaceae bacterium]|jgi:putative nucleotidyltransferase with HDIG domain|nr:HDOD domain-containing protein [Chitinispirillaceae bacterium]